MVKISEAFNLVWKVVASWLPGGSPTTVRGPAATVLDDLLIFLVALLVIGLGGEAFEWLWPAWGKGLAIVPLLGLVLAGWIAYTRTSTRGRSRRASALFSVAIVLAASVVYAEWSAWRGVPAPLVSQTLELGTPPARVAAPAKGASPEAR